MPLTAKQAARIIDDCRLSASDNGWYRGDCPVSARSGHGRPPFKVHPEGMWKCHGCTTETACFKALMAQFGKSSDYRRPKSLVGHLAALKQKKRQAAERAKLDAEILKKTRIKIRRTQKWLEYELLEAFEYGYPEEFRQWAEYKLGKALAEKLPIFGHVGVHPKDYDFFRPYRRDKSTPLALVTPLSLLKHWHDGILKEHPEDFTGAKWCTSRQGLFINGDTGKPTGLSLKDGDGGWYQTNKLKYGPCRDCHFQIGEIGKTMFWGEGYADALALFARFKLPAVTPILADISDTLPGWCDDRGIGRLIIVCDNDSKNQKDIFWKHRGFASTIAKNPLWTKASVNCEIWRARPKEDPCDHCRNSIDAEQALNDFEAWDGKRLTLPPKDLHWKPAQL